MEQQPAQATQPTASRNPNPPPRSFTRCHTRTRDGRQCRMRAEDPAIGLCYRHSLHRPGETDRLDDSLDLSQEIFAQEEGAYDTTESINSILSNIIELVAQGRISTRRAAVITYALSLMLRSAVIAERQAINRLPLDFVPFQHDWTKSDQPQSGSVSDGKQPFTPPTTPEEAIAAYENLRS
jgi:hypothetical protein